jgi:hypothetical protein
MLETDDGRILVPARMFSEQPVTLITRQAADG